MSSGRRGTTDSVMRSSAVWVASLMTPSAIVPVGPVVPDRSSTAMITQLRWGRESLSTSSNTPPMPVVSSGCGLVVSSSNQVYALIWHPESSSSGVVTVCMSDHLEVITVKRLWSNSGLTNWTCIGHSSGFKPIVPLREWSQAAGLKMLVGIDRIGKNCRARLMNMVSAMAVRQFQGSNHSFGSWTSDLCPVKAGRSDYTRPRGA